MRMKHEEGCQDRDDKPHDTPIATAPAMYASQARDEATRAGAERRACRRSWALGKYVPPPTSLRSPWWPQTRWPAGTASKPKVTRRPVMALRRLSRLAYHLRSMPAPFPHP